MPLMADAVPVEAVKHKSDLRLVQRSAAIIRSREALLSVRPTGTNAIKVSRQKAKTPMAITTSTSEKADAFSGKWRLDRNERGTACFQGRNCTTRPLREFTWSTAASLLLGMEG